MGHSGIAFRPGGGFSCCIMRETAGMRKAAVLPEPVCAQLIRSRFCSAHGVVNRWIGVGFR